MAGRHTFMLLRFALFLAIAMLCPATMVLSQVPTDPKHLQSRNLPILTTIGQVIDLGMEGARKNPHPVSVRGVITLNPEERATWIYVQDATGGSLVVYSCTDAPLEEGLEVDVEGVAAVGGFHTFIGSATVRVVGRKPMPEPAQTHPDRLTAGEDFAQWTRVRATIRNVARTGA